MTFHKVKLGKEKAKYFVDCQKAIKHALAWIKLNITDPDRRHTIMRGIEEMHHLKPIHKDSSYVTTGYITGADETYIEVMQIKTVD